MDHDNHDTSAAIGSDSSAHGGYHNMMMHMFFHGGTNATILFEGWEVSETGAFIGSVVAVFFLAFLYEPLKFYREHLYRHSFKTVEVNTVSLQVENGGAEKETHKTVQVPMLSCMHIRQTCLHVVQVVLSYFLMLIFMTYNYWLCLAVAAGAGAGYFFFGWKKSLVVDITEHCH